MIKAIIFDFGNVICSVDNNIFIDQVSEINGKNREEISKLFYKDLIDECFGGSNSLDYYKKNSLKTNYQIIVAKNENRIIGSITFYKIDLFTFSFQPALEIFNVAVLKKYRRKKVSQKLFDYIIDYAKRNGYKSIYLTCLETAILARKLYEKLGFIKTKSLKYNLDLR